VIVHLDTSVLVDALIGPRRSAAALERTVAQGYVIARAASLYRGLKRARGRDMDIAIAACALEHGASLWTLSLDDFRDMAGLELHDPGVESDLGEGGRSGRQTSMRRI
jgi:predicted nucleic acid-binding protein